MLKAVLFDLDGVITDSSRYHYLAWKSLADVLGIPFDEAYNEKLKGVSRMESLEFLLRHGGLQDKFTRPEKAALAARKNDLYRSLIRRVTPEDTLPGIREFLAELKSSSIKTAVASVSKNAPFLLDRLQLTGSFDYVADALRVQRAKPFPDIFLDAAKGTGALPRECVGIEDAAAGIEALRRAGIRSVGVGAPDQMGGADLRLHGTADLSLKLLLRTFSFDAD